MSLCNSEFVDLFSFCCATVSLTCTCVAEREPDGEIISLTKQVIDLCSVDKPEK